MSHHIEVDEEVETLRLVFEALEPHRENRPLVNRVLKSAIDRYVLTPAKERCYGQGRETSGRETDPAERARNAGL